MPKFKVTTDAGEGPEPEQPDAPDDLLEFPDLKSATEDAQIALAEIARDNMPDGKAAHFGVEVANEEGKRVYRASLDFHADTEEELDQEKGQREGWDVAS